MYFGLLLKASNLKNRAGSNRIQGDNSVGLGV